MTKIEQKQDELIKVLDDQIKLVTNCLEDFDFESYGYNALAISQKITRLESELSSLKAEAEKDTEILCEKLKARLVKHLMRNSSTLDNPYISTGDISYTRREVASEIENETEFGVRMLADMVFLAIDITSRKGKAEAEKEVTDADIEKWADETTDNNRAMSFGKEVGAKAMRDGKIKPNE